MMSRLAMPICITEYATDPAAAVAPTEVAPGIFCATQAPDVPPAPQLTGVLVLQWTLEGIRCYCIWCLVHTRNICLGAVQIAVKQLPDQLPIHAGVLCKWMDADLPTVKRLATSAADSPLAQLTWRIDAGPGVIVTAAPLAHRLPCWGYVFQVCHLCRCRPCLLQSDILNEASGSMPAAQPIARRPALRPCRYLINVLTVRDYLLQEGGSSGAQPNDSAVGNGAMIQPGRKVVLLGDTCNSTAMLGAQHHLQVAVLLGTYSIPCCSITSFPMLLSCRRMPPEDWLQSLTELSCNLM